MSASTVCTDAPIYRTPEHEKNMDFAETHFTTTLALLVPEVSDVSTLADTANKKVAVQQGSFEARYAEENADALIAAYATANDLTVLNSDRDFELIERALGPERFKQEFVPE
ncbi:ABC transporter substrate-binding protein [Leucobacter sp. wl10]|uniref:substrate-binding periplasmic protein n=1 Tax=Leucobacter sp. wl10 TaxID=2304677 RepID=UPI000E5C2293|nr:transporter substrate-binding domain-containing protein [Leucobacter sp. wl10]RGE24311.1 hypothetical protein D1J51_00805 [Leucobacter sp. wl10]